MKKTFISLALALFAFATYADVTYSPFLLGARDGSGTAIADGTYVMVLDMDSDGWGGTAYTAAGTGNASAWLWDADDVIMDQGAIANGLAAPKTIYTPANAPAGYAAGLSYYILWFDAAYDALATGPGDGVAYGAADLGLTSAIDSGHTFTPQISGNATLITAATLAVVVEVNGSDTLQVGFTATLAASTTNGTDNSYSWNSDTSAVATVDGTGVVTAVAAGTATITATGDDTGVADSLLVTVFADTDAAVAHDRTNGKLTVENPETGTVVWYVNGLLDSEGPELDTTGLADGDEVKAVFKDDNGTEYAQTDVYDFYAENYAPVATYPAAVYVPAGQTVSVPLAATDINGDELTLSIVQAPAQGTLGAIDQATQTVAYTANAAGTGVDTFTFKANDGELDSNVVDVFVYVTSTDGWLVELNADTADFPALYFGAEPNAADNGVDPYDELLPGEILPTRAVRNFAGLYSVDGDGVSSAYYQRDIRTIDGDYVWIMELEAYDENLVINWDGSSLPAGVTFTMVACDAAGTPLSGAVPADMSVTESVTAIADAGPTYYRIAAVSDEVVTFDLEMNDGWNLISIPIKPVPADVATVFAELNLGIGQARSFRDGSRGRVTSDQVWDWDEATQSYRAVDMLEAFQGYWVYVPEGNAATLTVTGRPAAAPSTLVQHWNLIGVQSDLPVDNADVSSSIFGWLNDNYFKTSTLVPGLGFWLYVFPVDGTDILR